jgi:hypothetical protein
MVERRVGRTTTGSRRGAEACQPNKALEPTAYSVRCAPAFGGGSPRALGATGAESEKPPHQTKT